MPIKPYRRSMPKRALIQHRPWLLASLVAAISYFFLADDSVPGLFAMVWKGLGVGFLAIYAWARGKGTDGTLIATALTLCAAGDMVLEISFLFGAGLFALAHCGAIALYLRQRRHTMRGSQRAAGIALAVGIPLIAALLAWPRDNWQLATLYAALLGAMAATAWTSRFPRYRVGAGAILFAVSDLVLVAREAERLDPAIAGWLVWPLYYGGVFMIATGVIQRLRHEHVAA